MGFCASKTDAWHKINDALNGPSLQLNWGKVQEKFPNNSQKSSNWMKLSREEAI